MDEVQHGGLQAGEGHVQRGVLDVDPRQLKGLVVAGLGGPIQGSAAGIAQAHDPRDLVKALAGRVVSCRAQDLHVGVAPHIHDERRAAGHAQADEGRL